MHIQQIEIDNFKSFSGKTVIPFEKGFTTISGPNGSGKSNIVDSILFCLGISSSRTMRAEKLTDLINNISKRREASVSIMFGNSDKEGEEKIIVTRRIKDSGQSGYGSTYYLNGKVATLTEIHDRLSQHHISPGAYNVLMQGDVTGIINMTALERRRIIDEIAGVAEFDRKIEQAQKELGSVSGSIERFAILMEEMKTRLEQLSQDREQALKYQKLKDEKHQFEGMMLTARFMDLKNAFEAAEHNIIKARKQKALSAENITLLDAQINKTKEELTRVAAEVKRKGEDQQIAIKKQIEGLKGVISRKKDSIQFAHQKKQENIRNIERSREEIQRLESKIEDLNVTLEGFYHQEKEFKLRIETEQQAVDDLKQSLADILDSTGKLGEQRSEIRKELTAAEDLFAVLGREKLDIEAELDRKKREKAYQTERSVDIGVRQQAVEAQKQELEKTISNILLEKQAFEAQIQKQQLELAQLKVALNSATSEINKLHREFSQLEAQKRAFEEMSFGRTVETVLSAGLDGVHGTLAQLGNVDEEFSLALEIALGGRMKSIVVEDDEVAQQGIELLQRTKTGRATFLPLNKMRQSQYLKLLPNDEGIIDYALNLIDFDPVYKDAFAYALGDTVIVEDMQVARKYLREYRMVTLEGSLLEKTGAMTGGSMSAQTGGKFSSGKLDQQIKTLRDQLEKKDEERERMEKKFTTAEIKLDSIKEDFGRFLTDLQKKQLELETLEREIKQINSSDSKECPDLEAIEKSIKAMEIKLGNTVSKLNETEEKIKTLNTELEEIDTKLPTDRMESLKNEINNIEFQIKSLESQCRNIASEIQSRELEKEFQEKGIQTYKEQIDQQELSNKDFEKEKQEMLEEIEATEKQIILLEAQTGELDEELQRLQADRDQVQAKLITEEREKYTLTKELSLIEEQILAYQTRQKELHPQMEAIKQELTETGISSDEISQKNLPQLEEIQKNIQRLGRQMEAMEPVNMRALQDYDEAFERHHELTDKINTLSREKEDLGIKISGYSELKLNAFITAFENVNNNFKQIFGELSEGEGQLVLTNQDDPFSGGLTIEARPRGKKMQRLEAMSGGEKSLTALAFVFSFQRYMPAPFYAFDEVDMFLDGINAEKLATMVKSQARAAQFIVVSLRKPMLQQSDRTIGVTQKRDGISKVTGVMLQDASC